MCPLRCPVATGHRSGRASWPHDRVPTPFNSRLSASAFIDSVFVCKQLPGLAQNVLMPETNLSLFGERPAADPRTTEDTPRGCSQRRRSALRQPTSYGGQTNELGRTEVVDRSCTHRMRHLD